MRPPAKTQSHLRYPLTRLFGDTAHVRLLRALSQHGDAQSATQLARATGLSAPGVLKALGSLETQGVVEVLGGGRSRVYRLASAHPLVQLLQPAFSEERARWDALQQALKTLLARQAGVLAAWLYGSVARGEDEPGSDVDVALLVEQRAAADRVRTELHELELRYGVHFSVVDLTRRDLQEAEPTWWANVCKDGRTLKGAPAAELAAALHRGPAA